MLFYICFKLAIEIVEQLQTIQLLTREEHFHQVYIEKINKALKDEKKSGPYEAILFAITTTFIFFTDMCSYAIGISLIYHGQSSPSQVFTYVFFFFFCNLLYY